MGRFDRVKISSLEYYFKMKFEKEIFKMMFENKKLKMGLSIQRGDFKFLGNDFTNFLKDIFFEKSPRIIP